MNFLRDGLQAPQTNPMRAPSASVAAPQPQPRFNDARSYQVAQQGSAQGFENLTSRPDISDDNVQVRRVQEEELNLRNSLNRLGSIFDEISANPETLERAQTLSGRIGTGSLAFRDRLGVDALDISPEQENQLAEVTRYKQQLLTNVNQYIKEITGATVGQGDETKRLMAVQANESDSPTQIIAKLEGAMDMARLEIARRRMMVTSGGKEMPSDADLRQMLMQRGQQYLQQAQTQGLDGNDARMWAAQQMQQEFGF